MGAPPNGLKEECEADLSPGKPAKEGDLKPTGKTTLRDLEYDLGPRELCECPHLPLTER